MNRTVRVVRYPMANQSASVGSMIVRNDAAVGSNYVHIKVDHSFSCDGRRIGAHAVRRVADRAAESVSFYVSDVEWRRWRKKWGAGRRKHDPEVMALGTHRVRPLLVTRIGIRVNVL